MLSADGSPQSVRPVGVRRLNHIPLYIVGVRVLAVVGLLVAWVATEKGKEQPAKPEDHGGSANEFAVQVVGDKVGYVRAENAPSPTPPSTPATVTQTAAATPPPNTETGCRHKAFYEALFAKSAISDPTVEQVSNQRQQAISAARAAKVVQADPNNLGGSTPGDISDYERKVADTQRFWESTAGNRQAARSQWFGDLQRVEGPVETQHAVGSAATPYILRTGWVIPALLAHGDGIRITGHNHRAG